VRNGSASQVLALPVLPVRHYGQVTGADDGDVLLSVSVGPAGAFQIASMNGPVIVAGGSLQVFLEAALQFHRTISYAIP
jgi:hypothetical protein